MKVYIVGKVASGKSTLAERLSELTGVPVYHLDDLVHDGNERRLVEGIEADFQKILALDEYLIEDTLRVEFLSGLQQVDRVVYIDFPQRILYFRVLKRFFKQKLGLEHSDYSPNLSMLKKMFQWLKMSPAEHLLALPSEKIIHLKSPKDVKNFIKKVEQTKKL